MNLHRSVRILAAALVALCASAADSKPPAGQWAANFNIPLWEDGKVPLALGTAPLDKPLLTVFLPPPGKANGAAVVVAPGGANIMLMYGAEGLEIAERFNEWGYAAFVLTYRLSPRYNDAARIADAHRAVQLIRARAAEWKLDPRRIGFAGFSAGSMLGRIMAAAAGPGKPDSPDPIARQGSRPDFLVLVYGPGRATPGEQLKDFPPTYLTAAAADRMAADASAQLFIDLNKAGAVAELHLYQKGRHGFGAAYRSPEFSLWMDSLRHFLKQGGFEQEVH
ncbi:alpha/beta hydrolase [Paludibaculum fermentans]|uniref:alpha/beta hydrolase n=1 Tax=Paludibaculum fermentans TaxID=1473598 RepID=UPI003EB9F666